MHRGTPGRVPPRRRRYGGKLVHASPFGRSRPVDPSRHGQRNAAIAIRGRDGVIAFEERRLGHDRVLLARTVNGGRTWSRPVSPTGRRAGAVDEQWPAVAFGPHGIVTVAWNDGSTGVQRVYLARSTDGGRRFGRPRPIDPSAPAGAWQWRAALAQGKGDLLHAVFVDDRAISSDDALPQSGIYYARVRAGAPQAARRLDAGQPADLAAKLDNAWAPRIAARGGRVLVSWVDFENYDWGVVSRASADGGRAFGPELRVTDNVEGSNQQEELADSPHPLLLPHGALVTWADWRKRASAGHVPHEQYDIYAAAPGKRNRQVDPYGARPVSTFSPSACVVANRALVAFQDASAARSVIRLVRVRGGVRRGRTLRVDDGGPGAGNAWRPQLACSGRRVVAAFETERDGPSQIYVARASW